MKRGILNIVEHDLRNFFRYKWWLAGLIAMNLADLFIMAVVYNFMLKSSLTAQIKSYFDFFAPGLAVTGLFASAFMIGREVNVEKRREIHHYMLSLPMSRIELAVGRVISGGVRGLIYMTPLLLTCFIFLGFPSLLQLLLILAMLFLLAMGISGLSISIAVSTGSFEKFVTARGLVYYTLFFCSSVFYPMSVIQSLGQSGQFPSILVTFAEVNPLSNGSDMIRNFLLGYPDFSQYWIFSALFFAGIFTLTAIVTYVKILAK